QNDSSSAGERWFYTADQGRLQGYDRQSKRWIGSFGPDGFVPPGEQPRERFTGQLYYLTLPYEVGPVTYFAFPSRGYTLDFEHRTIRTLFTPPDGQTVLWAVRWKDEKQKLPRVFIGTDQSVHVIDEAGAQIFSAPLAFDREDYGALRFGRLNNPQRFVVWYE